jgi:alkanesulfonate monooxygenase SsuD/methylene tetrahydromethanopterin reductase-like flavin-dependent oxidoreductase (luciferase family)
MKFGLCYIPDYHAELSGSWHDWYEGMIADVKLAEQLGFHGAWFAEHRVSGFAFGSPAMFIAHVHAREPYHHQGVVDWGECHISRTLGHG